MNTLILCTYMYKNSQSGANTLVKVCRNSNEAFGFALGTMRKTLSNDDEYSTIYDLMVDKTDTETETAIISFEEDEDGELEYDAGGFRLTLGDETHVCRYDPIVEGLVVELS